MIDYFVICHDPKWIQQCELSVMGTLPNLRYVLVGRTPFSFKLDREKIIVCNELQENIEHRPNLCSFTAWYAIQKNGLLKSDYVCLLEYDTQLRSNFHSLNEQIITRQKENRFILGYKKAAVDHAVFLKSSPWLEITLRDFLKIDLQTFVSNHKHKNPYWLTTTNILLPSQRLIDFVDWFFPLTAHFSEDAWGAFVHERMIYIYSILNQLNILFSENEILTHQERKSHGLSDLYGQFLKSKKTEVFCDKLEKEYDILYQYFFEKLSKGPL